MKECYLCGTREKELRPYGPKGEWVCFPCAMKDEETTKRSFRNQLEACGKVAVIGTDIGPHPIKHSILRTNALKK